LLFLDPQLIDARLERVEVHAPRCGVERAVRDCFPVVLADADEQLNRERLVCAANRGVDRRARRRMGGGSEEKSEQCTHRTSCWRRRGGGTIEL
jgi:hypothetical protein